MSLWSVRVYDAYSQKTTVSRGYYGGVPCFGPIQGHYHDTAFGGCVGAGNGLPYLKALECSGATAPGGAGFLRGTFFRDAACTKEANLTQVHYAQHWHYPSDSPGGVQLTFKNPNMTAEPLEGGLDPAGCEHYRPMRNDAYHLTGGCVPITSEQAVQVFANHSGGHPPGIVINMSSAQSSAAFYLAECYATSVVPQPPDHGDLPAASPRPHGPSSMPPSPPFESCSGASAGLPEAECRAWQAVYDGLGGSEWRLCSKTRSDPCSCADQKNDTLGVAFDIACKADTADPHGLLHVTKVSFIENYKDNSHDQHVDNCSLQINKSACLSFRPPEGLDVHPRCWWNPYRLSCAPCSVQNQVEALPAALGEFPFLESLRIASTIGASGDFSLAAASMSSRGQYIIGVDTDSSLIYGAAPRFNYSRIQSCEMQLGTCPLPPGSEHCCAAGIIGVNARCGCDQCSIGASQCSVNSSSLRLTCHPDPPTPPTPGRNCCQEAIHNVGTPEAIAVACRGPQPPPPPGQTPPPPPPAPRPPWPWPTQPVASGTWNWRNVNSQGFGWVSAVVHHPNQTVCAGCTYAHTDVGGAYRLDRAAQPRWVPITDGFTESSLGANPWMTRALAVHPARDQIYLAVASTVKGGTGEVLESSDRGASWEATGLAKAGRIWIGIDGDGDRWHGESLAVAPSGTVLLGTPRNGTWLRRPGAAWTQTSGIAAGSVGFVRFVGERAFAGVSGKGIFGSSDGGATWAAVGECSFATDPHYATDSGGSLVFTYQPAGGADKGGIARLDVATGACADVGAKVEPASRDDNWGGVSCVGASCVAITSSFWWLVSSDSGASWGSAHRGVGQVEQEVPWFANRTGDYYATMTHVSIDPAEPSALFATDGMGVLHTSDYTAGDNARWRALMLGLEEGVANGCVAPPVDGGADVISVGWDYLGLRQQARDEVPTSGLRSAFGLASSGGLDRGVFVSSCKPARDHCDGEHRRGGAGQRLRRRRLTRQRAQLHALLWGRAAACWRARVGGCRRWRARCDGGCLRRPRVGASPRAQHLAVGCTAFTRRRTLLGACARPAYRRALPAIGGRHARTKPGCRSRRHSLLRAQLEGCLRERRPGRELGTGLHRDDADCVAHESDARCEPCVGRRPLARGRD